MDARRRLEFLIELNERLDDVLTEFSGGYVNTDQGVLKETGPGAHFTRNAGKYTGAVIAGPLGALIGWPIDASRRKRNRAITEQEDRLSKKLAKLKARGYREMSAIPHERLTEFGLLGAGKPGDYRRPEMVKTSMLPRGMAAYQVPEGVEQINRMHPGHPLGGTGKKLKYGQIIESDRPNFAGDMPARLSGYRTQAEMEKALRRHELKHSITASKRGYKMHPRIRDLVADEIGAYRRMNKGVKGGSRILRTVNSAVGVPLSTGLGISTNPNLKKRFVRRVVQAGVGGAVLAAGGLGIAAYRGRKNRSESS